MRLRKIHLEFWQIKRGVPKWAASMNEHQRPPLASSLIDGCINAHAEIGKEKCEKHHAGNVVSLLKSVRRRGENMADYLQQICINPGTLIRPQRRAGFARKWLKRLRSTRYKQGCETTLESGV